MTEMTADDAVQVKQLALADVIPLRQQVLRQGRPVASCYFAGDDGSLDTRHFGVIVNDSVTAIASLYPVPFPLASTLPAWQLRGVATTPSYRGRGFASLLVAEAIAFATAQGASLLWCNVRRDAQGLYRRQGFYPLGDEFMIDEIGWHQLMRRDLC
jgi:GNAT superfamily N-acetyltransferase